MVKVQTRGLRMEKRQLLAEEIRSILKNIASSK